MNDYQTGFAFVFEGDTEKVFYEVFLDFLCKKHNAKIERKGIPSSPDIIEENEDSDIPDDSDIIEEVEDDEIPASPDIIYELITDAGTSLIKYNVANTVSQVPQKGPWFKSQCIDKYNNSSDEQLEWYVFLCYDRDNYKEDISQFFEGDWNTFRNDLSALVSDDHIIDIAAAADIEDIMLLDLPNVCNFIGCDIPNSLKGRKGKPKIKKLFRDNGRAYHAGTRAKPLIEALDMEIIMRDSVIPLEKIEEIMFK